ncbi:hypothetical protein C812_03832 [Paenibacillus barengoltzii G22]|uniref:Uncharacterized protein n=1 Tax=Paenibacillus barengoltzii G22 TaxID=1235795 RepID=R9L721_9BACL|nr:hypothetical protein C812_03832 [Paenibacillus barengoltzii G22]
MRRSVSSLLRLKRNKEPVAAEGEMHADAGFFLHTRYALAKIISTWQS